MYVLSCVWKGTEFLFWVSIKLGIAIIQYGILCWNWHLNTNLLYPTSKFYKISSTTLFKTILCWNRSHCISYELIARDYPHRHKFTLFSFVPKLDHFIDISHLNILIGLFTFQCSYYCVSMEQWKHIEGYEFDECLGIYGGPYRPY